MTAQQAKAIQSSLAAVHIYNSLHALPSLHVGLHAQTTSYWKQTWTRDRLYLPDVEVSNLITSVSPPHRLNEGRTRRQQQQRYLFTFLKLTWFATLRLFRVSDFSFISRTPGTQVICLLPQCHEEEIKNETKAKIITCLSANTTTE